MEARPGTYALVLEVSWTPPPSAAPLALDVGKLGSLVLLPGFYLYIGSAFGPGGVRARVAHHRRITDHPHWHIDYLRPLTQLREIWYTYDPRRREHHWAEMFRRMRGSAVPLAGFGASDCACVTHLYRYARCPAWSTFRRKLTHTYHEHTPLSCYTLTPPSA